MHFVLWCREVHADFGAAKIMAEGNREKLIAGMRYKQKAVRSSDYAVDLLLKRKPDTTPISATSDSFCHPSWERRIKYAETGAFDENLIRITPNGRISYHSGENRHILFMKKITQVDRLDDEYMSDKFIEYLDRRNRAIV